MINDWKPEWLNYRGIKTIQLERNEDTELKGTLIYFSQKIELMLPKKLKAETARQISSTCDDFSKTYSYLEQYEKEDPDELAIITTAQEFNQIEKTVRLCKQATELETIATMFDLGKRWEVWSCLVSISSQLVSPDDSNKEALRKNAKKAGKSKRGHKSCLHLALEMIIRENKIKNFTSFEACISNDDFLSDFSERLNPPAPCKLFEYRDEILHYMNRKGEEKTVSKRTLKNIITKYK